MVFTKMLYQVNNKVYLAYLDEKLYGFTEDAYEEKLNEIFEFKTNTDLIVHYNHETKEKEMVFLQ